jgi:iron complex transport system permease protein
MKYLTKKKWLLINGSLIAILAITLLIALTIGPEGVSWRGIFEGTDARSQAIVLMSRLPRILLAALVGMALASAGGSYQAMLRNPLADPFILGVAGGAALASVIAMGLGIPFVWISVAAFGGAAAAMAIIFSLARTRGRMSVHTLLLTGVIFNAFCFALILFVNAVVTMEQAYQILFLLIGNLEVVDMRTVAVTAVFVLTGFVILCWISGNMNALSLGDDQAAALGVNAEAVRRIIFFAGSLMVGAAVAVSGLIGFVGLFIPHAVRLALGSDHRLLIPASGFIGAAFLVAADTAARTALMNTSVATQLPVGVITALIGAPAFMWLLRRQLQKA